MFSFPKLPKTTAISAEFKDGIKRFQAKFAISKKHKKGFSNAYFSKVHLWNDKTSLLESSKSCHFLRNAMFQVCKNCSPNQK
jgi:hypothetical protein